MEVANAELQLECMCRGFVVPMTKGLPIMHGKRTLEASIDQVEPHCSILGTICR